MKMKPTRIAPANLTRRMAVAIGAGALLSATVAPLAAQAQSPAA